MFFERKTRVQFITAIDIYLLSITALIRLGSVGCRLRTRSFLTRTAAAVSYRVSWTKRRLSEQNLSQAFNGKLTPDELRRIVKSSFYQFWLEAFSIPQPRVPDEGGVQVEILGLEHLQRAKDNGKGAILWESGYFGRRFLMKRILHQNGFAVHQVYGENHAAGFYTPCPASWVRRRLITPLFDNYEKQYVAEILALPLWEPLPVVRVLFERLKRNGIICTAGDGTLGWSSVRKSFLRRERIFYTGMVSLSRSTGAPILPVFCVEENKDKVVIIIEPAINVAPTMDRASASEFYIERFASLLEKHIKNNPAQYYNWHFQGDSGANSREPNG
jgi:lauroyl/myristoyl acyltransferase